LSKKDNKNKARLVKIKNLYRLDIDINLDVNGEAVAVWNNYCFQYDLDQTEMNRVPDKVIPQFPIIYKGDGSPWDLGNLYLYDYWCKEADTDAKFLSTIIKKAKNLLAYLQWMEEVNLNEFFSPQRSRKFQRVTYMYKSYLEGEIHKRVRLGNGHGISPNTAAGKSAEVAQFYQWIERKNNELSFLPNDVKIKNVFYSEVRSMRKYGKGFIETLSTDLHFKKSTKRERFFDGRIYAEEGTSGVRPLSERDVQFLMWALREATDDRQMQLMYWFLLFTGARKQVVCTLTIGAVKLAIDTYKMEKIAYIPVGVGTYIDNKNDYAYCIQVPVALLQQIYNWVMYSPVYKRRKELSFYGDSDKNYAFLTKNGNPFYMSKRQIRDIQDYSVSRSVAKKDRIYGGGKSSEGSALNSFADRKLIAWITDNFNELVDRWNKKHELIQQFKPHDEPPPFQEGFHPHNLRATFGMRFVRQWEQALIEQNKELSSAERTVCMGKLKRLMGHESEVTTWHYLDFSQLLKEKELLDMKLEAALYPNDILEGIYEG
jgi:integrase